MAAIQIPYGGTSISIDVPDFALETTQQDIARESSESNNILSQIASHMGVEVKLSQEQSKATDQLVSKINQQTQETKSLGRQFKDGISRMGRLGNASTSIQNSVGGIGSGREAMSQLVGKQGFLGNIPGLANAGASIGSLFGILEEFGASLGALRRVGAGVGSDLQLLRAEAAEVGISLETLGKIVTDNGTTVRSLGRTTVEGTRNFIELNKELRSQTESLGFFGMAADELAAILTDEIEIRRRASALNANENIDRQALAKSIKENLRLQEAMAAATGIDLTDRVKAQNEFRRDAQIAMRMRSMTAEEQATMQVATGDLTLFGERGSVGYQMVSDLIKNGLIDGNIGQVAGAAEVSGLLSTQGVDLAGTTQSIVAAIERGDKERVTELMRDLSTSMKNIDSPELNRLAISNDAAATAIQMAADAIGYTAEQLEQAARVQADPANQAQMDSSAIANRLDVAASEFRVTLMESILKAFNVDSIQDSNFNTFVKQLEQFPTSEGFTQFMDMVSNFNATTSGAAGIVFTATDIGDPGAAKEMLANTLTINALLEGIGVSTGAAGKAGKLAAFLNAGFESGAIDKLPTAIGGLTEAIKTLAEKIGYEDFQVPTVSASDSRN